MGNGFTFLHVDDVSTSQETHHWASFTYFLPNPSSRTMALGFTQPLTEIRPSRKADILSAICELGA
jgi:hypothetical protein